MARTKVHPNFLNYTQIIAQHPVYAGMPDAYKDDKNVQWEAPSNRGSGKFKDSHVLRLRWWENKAKQVGIDPTSSQWKSRTAKKIHPFQEKPCGVCGRNMALSYSYPSGHLFQRIKKLPYYAETFELDELEHITDLISRLVNSFGHRVFADLPRLLACKGVEIPDLGDTLPKWLEWIKECYIPCEPNMLSPGAMANPPDRFDGFHTYNRCCRHVEDKGRSTANLRTYSTDRRVFEFWNEGDWIAADRLMGQIRSQLRSEPCRNGHAGPCDADHIGPLSLGFAHRPEFQFLCSACNSAKNNRMTFNDVQHLREVEASGATVISWYAKTLWDMTKAQVSSDETALRLSKLLRDNRHTALSVLQRLAKEGHYAFLVSLLPLEYADYDVSFENLRVVNHMTNFVRLIRVPRTTKYAVEQKARYVRIALASLVNYSEKDNRSTYELSTPDSLGHIDECCRLLTAENVIKEANVAIGKLLSGCTDDRADLDFRRLVEELPSLDPACFVDARRHLTATMSSVAPAFAAKWDDERYVR